MRETSAASPAQSNSHSPKARSSRHANHTELKNMSENDKWVWSSDEEPIAALFRPEPSTSKTDAVLRLDPIAPDMAKIPAASASLGKALALHLVGKAEAALKELAGAIDGGENLAELH